jgi:hypothetical protein
MTQHDPRRDRLGRRAKRFLSPTEKYELWPRLATGELSQSEAAERFGIDRSTVMRIRQVAKQANQYGKLRWCTERRHVVVEFWLLLALMLIVVGRLIRRAWTDYRWEGRPRRRP